MITYVINLIENLVASESIDLLVDDLKKICQGDRTNKLYALLGKHAAESKDLRHVLVALDVLQVNPVYLSLSDLHKNQLRTVMLYCDIKKAACRTVVENVFFVYDIINDFAFELVDHHRDSPTDILESAGWDVHKLKLCVLPIT